MKTHTGSIIDCLKAGEYDQVDYCLVSYDDLFLAVIGNPQHLANLQEQIRAEYEAWVRRHNPVAP